MLVIALSGYIIWRSTDGFETAADYLGRNLSHGIKGATINAIASSMPEFLATIFFLFYIKDPGVFSDSFSGGIGITAGSAVFNILIIPVAVLFWVKLRDRNMRVPMDRKLLKRDGIVLVLANVIIILVLRQKSLDPLDGVLLIIIYVAYLAILWNITSRKSKKEQVKNESVYPANDIGLKHLLKIDLTAIFLNGRKMIPARAWVLLLISVSIMCIGTWLLVIGTHLLGKEEYTLFGRMVLPGLNIPLIFVSVLLASAASSIPDTMISMRDARKGNFDDSISNALGSNIFDISFALGLPLLIYTLIYGPIEMSDIVRKWSLSIWLVLLLINLAVIPLFIHIANFGRKHGLVLIGIYFLFIFFVIEETARIGWVSRLVEFIIQK